MGLLNGTQESDNLIIYLNIYAKDDLKQYEPRKIFDIANEAFKSVILELNYSYAATSAIDFYEFSIINEQVKFVKLDSNNLPPSVRAQANP